MDEIMIEIFIGLSLATCVIIAIAIQIKKFE